MDYCGSKWCLRDFGRAHREAIRAETIKI